MITETLTIDLVIREIDGVTRSELDRWIENQWVRPDPTPTGYSFAAIDLARTRLIHELVSDLHINDDALPVVLSLLDQLYDLRRRLHDLGEAITQTAPPDVRARLIARLTRIDPQD
ncbi:chaperone modulator CbpM [Acidiphilium sp.]|uniref:chaperone modulator CbpM n=1 Tax=Acidiphilium sp. TaxID=527 RepID=UPI003D028654